MPPLRVPGRSGLEARWFLEIFGLAGAAVAQPLLSVFGASPEVFIAADAGPVDVVGFALAVLLTPPLVLWCAGLAAGVVGPRARWAAHLATVGALSGLLALYALRRVGWPAAAVGVVAAVAAGGVVLMRRAWSPVGTLMRYLAVGPVAFLVAFCVLSPAGELIGPGGARAAAVTVDRPGELPPVVMVVFDEWPLSSIVTTDGSIDADLFPNLAALAGGATWYRNTTTVTNATLQAVPSLLTGRFPAEGQTATARSQPENLFTLLGGVYDVEAVEPMTALCPAAVCDSDPDGDGDGAGDGGATGSLLAEAARTYATLVSPAAVDAGADTAQAAVELVDRAGADTGEAAVDAITRPRPAGLDSLLGTITADEAPTVHFLHLLMPHAPYMMLPTGERYPQGPFRWDTRRGVRGDAQPSADFDRHRMLLQVGYVDSLVGDLLRRLRRAGLYDEALIVVTADHGVTFQAGATARGLGDEPLRPDTMHDMAWVPLIVKAPGQTAGRVDDRNALTVDVLPTIAETVGVDIPWPVDGIPLTGPPRAGDHKPFFRQVGLSGSSYRLESDTDVGPASLDDVFAGGVDTFLAPGRDTDRWWRFGPRPDLIGRSVTDLAQGPPSGMGPARLETGSAIEVAAGEDLPAMAVGRVGDGGDGANVAVAVDGRIAAVVPLYSDVGGAGRVAAMLARSALTVGSHRVRLFEVAGDPNPALRAVEVR